MKQQPKNVDQGADLVSGDRSAGSILIIVLITLLFTATALIAFLDKASNDLLVEARVVVANRLRMDAYSAAEVTMAVLEDFRQAGSGLHSPSEGWADPLAWAGWSPADGNTVEVTLQDESGKIPLIHANVATLTALFDAWQMQPADAQRLTDALLSWMQKTYVPTTGLAPDYQSGALPFEAPLRPLRSFSELAAIDVAKDLLFDKLGQPNELWWKFYADFSIFDYAQPNINGAPADVLAAIGSFGNDQQQNISNYLNGGGNFAATSPLGKQWFQNSSSVSGIVGSSGSTKNFAYTISALRILVTVHERGSQFRLSVIVSPTGSAQTVQTTATDVKKSGATSSTSQGVTGNGLNGNSTTQSAGTATAKQDAAGKTAATNLQYPFTILEIRENDQILNQVPTPPIPST